MRLVCPNCDAEYEVADDAIPDAGRDVQCSNCGHAWFQMSLQREAEEEAEAAVFDPPPGFDLPQAEPRTVARTARDTTMPGMSVVAARAPEPPPDAGLSDRADSGLTIPGISNTLAPGPAMPDAAVADGGDAIAPPAARSIDDSVLAVLREEAEREIAARRAEAAPRVETQTEMPLAPPPGPASGGELHGAARHIARMKGLDPDAEGMAEPVRAPGSVTSDPQRLSARRDLLPDIEEINSTLRASSDRNDTGNAATRRNDAVTASASASREGFRSAFILTLLVAVLLVVSYAMAPRIAAQVPQVSGALEGYVSAVNAARLWLDGAMRSVIGMLEG